jgi:hypothetical protein
MNTYFGQYLTLRDIREQLIEEDLKALVVSSLSMLLRYLPKVKTTTLSHDGRLESRDMTEDLSNVA